MQYGYPCAAWHFAEGSTTVVMLAQRQAVYDHAGDLGLLPLTAGSVWFEGSDISKVKAHRVVQGLVQAPEGRGVFSSMTVVENLEMGCYGFASSKAEHKERLDWVLETFPRLAEQRHQVGGASGEQQMLAIAPTWHGAVLLLDEPSMEVGPDGDLADLQDHRRDQLAGTTVLLVERMQQALSRSIAPTSWRPVRSPAPGMPGDGGRRQHSRRLPRRCLAADSRLDRVEHSLIRQDTVCHNPPV